MNDTLHYISQDPIYRTYRHRDLTFRQLYAYQENFTQSLSYNEVEHGRGSLTGKMLGERWQRFANRPPPLGVPIFTAN